MVFLTFEHYVQVKVKGGGPGGKYFMCVGKRWDIAPPPLLGPYACYHQVMTFVLWELPKVAKKI